MFSLLLLLACTPPGTTTPGGPGEPPPGAPDGDPSTLDVAIRPRAREGALPQEVAFSLSMPVFPSKSVGGPPPEGTVVKLTPEVPGELVVSGRSMLVWRPAVPLQPEVTYEISLEQVGGAGPVPEAWREAWKPVGTSFTTPSFKLVSTSLKRWDRDAALAEVNLNFAGPVDPAEVARRLSLRLGGRALQPAAVSAGTAPEVVRVTLKSPLLGKGPGSGLALDLHLEAGVPLLGIDGIATPATDGALAFVSDAPPVELRKVDVVEGLDGFYVDVICDDGAVEGKRFYWDRASYDDFRVSDRCVLDEAALATMVHVTPAVPLTVGPADGGFRLFGAFGYGPVTLRIDAGARTVDGGAFTEAVEAELQIPHRAPRVRFASQGRYLPRDAWQTLGLRHTNVAAVEVEVRHVPPANLVFWASGADDADERSSDLVARKVVPLRSTLDRELSSTLDLRDLVPDASSGVYQVIVRESEPMVATATSAEGEEGGGEEEGDWLGREGWQPEARAEIRIVRTDLALIAKRGGVPEGAPTGARPANQAPVWVWAVDVNTNDPVPGVELSLVKRSGTALATCVSGGDGGCVLAARPDLVDDGEAFVILARKGTDLTYLPFGNLQDEPDGDVSGLPWGGAQPWVASVWAERGVYRPGDTVHLAALLRDAAQLPPRPDMPALFRVYDARGREVRKVVAEMNEAGLATLDLPLADLAATGSWNATLEVADRAAGSTSFAVEEFVPERMKVEVKARQPNLLLDEAAEVGVDGRWLFGGVAAQARVELECRIEPAPFAPVGWEGWRFGPGELPGERRPRAVPLGMVEGHLDEAGHADLRCPARGVAATGGQGGRLVARASVFEGASGRTTVGSASVPVHPDHVWLGLKTRGATVKAGAPVVVEGVVLGWDGQVQTAPRTVELTIFPMEEEAGWYYDTDSDTSSYRRTLRRAPGRTEKVTVTGGKFSTSFTPTGDADRWLVVAAEGKARTELLLEGEGRDWYWGSWDRTVDVTPRPQKPTALSVKLPASARVGDKVTATVEAPYAGRILWTVETDGVQSSAWQTVSAGPASWTVPVTTFHPNVYVSAMLLKDPHLESQLAFMPDRAFGVGNLRVEPTAYTMDLKLAVPAEVRPRSPLTVEVSTTLPTGGRPEPTWVTVAAVDAGILSLTRHPDPDPQRDLFAPRRLGVESFETIGWTMFHEPAGPSGRTGGDAAGGAGGRVQMVKPVALWSGPVKLGADGKGKVTLDVPGYRGTLRVMAVAASAGRTGHAAADVVVREPLTLTTTLPRFLGAGDRAQVPVMVTNLSGKAQVVDVRMKVEARPDPGQDLYVDVSGAEPILGFDGAQQGRLSLAPDASGTVVFQLSAKNPGAAHVTVEATAGGLSTRDELDLPVQSPAAQLRRTVQIPLDRPETDLAAALDGWLDGTDRHNVWVTRNPYGAALARMRHLFRYPHGCIEQTTSGTRPLLYVRNLVEEVAPDLVAQAKVDDLVNAGLDRVRMMQTPSGGFGYWPGSDEPVLWGTAYATHLLLDAEAQGYAVPEGEKKEALSWLERQLDRTYEVSPSELAYAHYVLARAGRPHAAQAARLLDAADKDKTPTPVTLDDESRTLLMAAIQQSGDRRYEAALKRPAVHPIGTSRPNNAWYGSELRDAGVRLSVYRDLFGPDGAGELADSVAAQLAATGDDWSYTTQELAWGVTGLGKSVGAPTGAVPTPSLLAAGKLLPALPRAADASGWSWALADVDEAVTVKLSGTGGRLYAVVNSEGARPDGEVPWGGSGLALKRSWIGLDGKPLDASFLPLGEAFYVKLELRNPTGSAVANVALVDRLPAGWEIENPRLGRDSLPEGVDPESLWATEHLDLRDDHLAAFGTVPARGTVTVIYMVRTVTAGRWALPPAHAEAMYDPTRWARERGGTVTVNGNWAGFLL